MKPSIHPTYRQVVFHDLGADHYMVIGSTIKTDRTIDYQGAIYPYVTLDVSAHSHPFYTGKQKEFAKEGSAARFAQRFGRFFEHTKKGKE